MHAGQVRGCPKGGGSADWGARSELRLPTGENCKKSDLNCRVLRHRYIRWNQHAYPLFFLLTERLLSLVRRVSLVLVKGRADNLVALQVSKAARDLQSKNLAALQPILDKLKGVSSGERFKLCG